MKKMIAKFLCDKAVLDNRDPKYQKSVDVELNAVCATDSLEDQDFNQATPSGNLSMFIDNPKALDFFQAGKKYYVEFTPAPPENNDEICVFSNGDLTHGEHIHSGRVAWVENERIHFSDGMIVSLTDTVVWEYLKKQTK